MKRFITTKMLKACLQTHCLASQSIFLRFLAKFSKKYVTISRKFFEERREKESRSKVNRHFLNLSLKTGSKVFTKILLTFCFLTFCNAALASSQNDLTPIEDYLNNIKNLTAKFVQESEGGLVEGKFYLSRNSENSGKMRVEYLAEPKILIVVNGAVLSYYDVELDEISHISTNTTPASFLTRPKISFSAKDIEVTKVEKSQNQISISLVKKNRKDAGEFTLVFDLNPIRFVKMKVKNDLNQTVSVSLSDIDFNSPIPNKMFVLRSKNN